jgi:hypothetical protein
LNRLNEPVLDHFDGDNGVVNKIITIVPADPVVEGQEIKGDDGTFIHCGVVVLCECACHALAEETVWVKITTRREWVCVEKLQAIKLFCFKCTRQTASWLMALCYLCVT